MEMVIAMSIAAGLAVAAYGALNSTIKAEEKIKTVTQVVDEHDRVWQYLASDLLYAVPRTWLDRNGEYQSAMIGVLGDRLSQSDIVSSEDYILQFVRGSRDNLLNLPRSSLMAVGYRVTQDAESSTKTLWRDSWAPIDLVDEPQVQQRLLLEGIDSLAFRYLPHTADSMEDAAWKEGWPANQTDSNAKYTLPVAIEVTIESKTMGKIIRLFPLSALSQNER